MALLRSAWANRLPVAEGRVGHHRRRGRGVRHAVDGLDSPGLRDSVRDGETGYLVPHGDVRTRWRPACSTSRGSARSFAGSGGGSALRRGPDVGARRGRHRSDISTTSSPARRIVEPGGGIMQTTISARHCEISDALRERARTVVERLGSLAPRPIEATVVFDGDGPSDTVELRLHLSRGEVLIATRRGDRSPDRARSGRGKAPPPAGEGSSQPRRSRPSQATTGVMLRLRDFLSRRGDPLQLETLTGEHRARPAAARRRGRESGPRPRRVHRPVRSQPAPRARRDRDHLSATRFPREQRPTLAGAVLRASTCPASS